MKKIIEKYFCSNISGSNRCFKVIISWILVILNLCIIFYFSSKPATESKELSGNITKVVVDTVKTIAPESASNITVDGLHNLIRKNAHFISYLMLGILTIIALRKVQILGINSVIIALLICLFYAISDELHQTIVPGRSCELRDVIIDMTGASVGLLLFFTFRKYLRKRSAN